MRGVTITFAPDKGSNGSTFDLKQGVVNQYVQVSGNQRFGAMPKLYNRVRNSVGDAIINTSQTYRNSEYTVFIVMGTIGGNDEGAQDATKFYGQWSGTNLPAQVSYQLVTDRITGDTGNTIVEIDDSKWNETNGNKITLKPGDLNGGGSFDTTTSTGNRPSMDEGDEEVDAPQDTPSYECDRCGGECSKKVYSDGDLVRWNTKEVAESHNAEFVIEGIPFIKISNKIPTREELETAVGVLDDFGWEVPMEIFLDVDGLRAYINTWGGIAFPVAIVERPGEYNYNGESVNIEETGIYFIDAYTAYSYDGFCSYKNQ